MSVYSFASGSKRFESNPGLSPEEHLLIQASRIRLSLEEGLHFKHLLEDGPDWPNVVQGAKRFGVLPLLYKHLSEGGRSSLVPDPVMAELRIYRRFLAFRTFQLHRSALQLFEKISDRNLRVMPLKGIYLGEALYGDITLRPVSDIDILCRKEDLDTMHCILESMGYRQPVIYKSKLHERLLQGKSSHCPPYCSKQLGQVEVHTHTLPGIGYDHELMESVWRSSKPFSFGGAKLNGLSLEDQLFHLSLHLHHHAAGSGGIALYWFCDIHEWISKNVSHTDWERFCHRAVSVGVNKRIGELLVLMKTVWHTDIPPDALEMLDASGHSLSMKQILHREKSTYFLTSIKKIRRATLIPGWSNRCRYMARYLFPQREYLLYRYKPKRADNVWIYRILHPLRVVYRGVSSIAWWLLEKRS